MKDTLLTVAAFLLWPVVALLLAGLIWLVFAGQLHLISGAFAGIIVIAIAKLLDGP